MANRELTLLELEPRWISENVFIFKCPCCRDTWLSCKNVVMSIRKQWELFDSAMDNGMDRISSCKPSFSWTFSSKNFADLTVIPSIDASTAKHWHGHITNGKIT
jgi:hypothetical protein